MKWVDKNRKNLLSCRCKVCPSYKFACKVKAAPELTKAFVLPKNMQKITHLESLFCAYEPSRCIKVKKGCLCPNCPVHKKYELSGMYYCLPSD